MKRIFLTLLLGLPLLLVSCIHNPDNSNYPKQVHFGMEGGSATVSGDGFTASLSIITQDGNVVGEYYPEIDSVSRTVSPVATSSASGSSEEIEPVRPWLKVKSSKLCGPEITIIAEPNTTGKFRTLYVSSMSFDLGFDIKVTQSGN